MGRILQWHSVIRERSLVGEITEVANLVILCWTLFKDQGMCSVRTQNIDKNAEVPLYNVVCVSAICH